jgi:hypothetical protein
LALWDSGVTTGMRGMAARLDLRYAGTTSDRAYKEDIGALQQIGVLSRVEPDKQVDDLMYGRYKGRNVEIFNCRLGSFPDDPGHAARSCVLVTFTALFPKVSIGPHTRMSKLRLGSRRQWIAFAPESFRQRFLVDAADNETARTILSDDVIAWLMAGRDDVHLTIERGALLGHMPRLGEEDPRWEPFIDFVLGFHAVIPPEAWMEHQAFGI